ncbi:MAG TPA: hypothetical protein VFB58_02575 [Chloroflexota bacterium]|nr:hypothetical protein [Chloroflexota bacterium]
MSCYPIVRRQSAALVVSSRPRRPSRRGAAWLAAYAARETAYRRALAPRYNQPDSPWYLA